MLKEEFMQYKPISLILLALLLTACSSLSGEKVSAPQSHELPQQAVTVVADTQQQAAEKTLKTTDIVEVENAKIAASLVKPALTQPVAATPTAVIEAKPAVSESAILTEQASLILNMPYPQAWLKTKKALSQAGYPVMEQDNVSATYYILDKVGTGGVIKRDTPIYQLQLQKTTPTQTTLILHNAQNQPAASAVAKRVMGALQRQLSN
jgi:uncharacterized lipoprotein